MFVEIQTHGFTAQSFGFKGRLLNHIVGLLPKQIIAIIHDLMLNHKWLASCNLCDFMWFYIKY